MKMPEHQINYHKPASEIQDELSFLTKIKIAICGIVGHKWQFRDYSNYITSNGDKYPFSKSRECTRCHQVQYFYSDWKTELKKMFV
jgi:hypothetical protein